MGCLALNASFEPLTIVPARRAVRLVLDGKAEIIVRGVLHAKASKQLGGGMAL